MTNCTAHHICQCKQAEMEKLKKKLFVCREIVVTTLSTLTNVIDEIDGKKIKEEVIEASEMHLDNCDCETCKWYW